MKTLIKIVIAFVMLTAAFQAGRAALANYQFEDAVHEGLLFNPRASESEIVDMVLKAAQEYDLPVEASGVTVRESRQDLIVEITYTTAINLVPGIYSHDFTFHPNTSTKFFTGSRR
jgi:hypothetical protein